jgi:hypothetical protein
VFRWFVALNVGEITVGVKSAVMALEGQVTLLVESSSPWVFNVRI